MVKLDSTSSQFSAMWKISEFHRVSADYSSSFKSGIDKRLTDKNLQRKTCPQLYLEALWMASRGRSLYPCGMKSDFCELTFKGLKNAFRINWQKISFCYHPMKSEFIHLEFKFLRICQLNLKKRSKSTGKKSTFVTTWFNYLGFKLIMGVTLRYTKMAEGNFLFKN